MSEEKLLLYFALTGLVGLVIMIIGLKLPERPKKIFETFGAVVFHVGVFGVLYFKVSITLFISLVALVLSLFILIDPLKIALHVQQKWYRRSGYFLLAMAIAFLTMYFTNFPVWLWLIPLVVYLLPFVVPPLKKQEALLGVMAWVCVFVYLGLISYAIYSRFYPDNANQQLTSWFTKNPGVGIMSTIDSDQQKLKEKLAAESELQKQQARSEILQQDAASKPTTEPLAFSTENNEEPLLNSHREDFRLFSQDGPFLKSLREADNKYLKLRDEFRRLKNRVKELERENTELKAKQGDPF